MLEEEEYQFAMSQSCQGTMVFCKESFNTKVWGGGGPSGASSLHVLSVG